MEDHRISNIVNSHEFGEKRELSIEFGYILDMVGDDEEQYYIAVLGREHGVIRADQDVIVMPLGHTLEELTSFGSPEDLIGRRVRVEFIGNHWENGVAFLTGGRELNPVGTSMDIPSRGFRHAVAGGGSI